VLNSKVDLNAVAMRVAQGDEDAYSELASAIQGISLRIGRWFGRSVQVHGQDGETFAEDLAHDVTLKVLAGLPENLIGVKSIRGWVSRIARNEALNQLRALRRRRIEPPAPDHSADTEGDRAAIEQIAAPEVDRTLNLDLGRVMGTFAARGPAAQRRLHALRIHTLEGYSQREIARHFSVRRETVNGWIKSAKVQLSKLLQADGRSGYSQRRPAAAPKTTSRPPVCRAATTPQAAPRKVAA